MSSSNTPDPLAAFPSISRDTIRYGDTDRQGHVNNAVYSAFYETGRVHALDRAGASDDGSEVVLATITIDYLQEILWPGEVLIGTRVKKIGTTSVTFEQILVTDGVVKSRSTSVTVRVDAETHKPAPLTDDQRSRFASLEAE